MRFSQGFSLAVATLAMAMSSGCAPNANNEPPHSESSAVSPSETPAETPPAMATSAPTISAPETSPDSALPFIAEAKAVFQVIDRLSPGRLEVVDGCLTVAVRGGERATAVFPPGVKPQWNGGALRAVSFEGRTIPVDQETSIPGGVIVLPSADLVKSAPTNCPKTLFGLGG